MKNLSISDIQKAVNGKLIYGNSSDMVSGVSIDSREVGLGDIFFAIVGEFNDGHKYIEDVLAKGCRTIVISNLEAIDKIRNDIADKKANILLVNDTTDALVDLGKYYFSLLPIKKVVGITGSVGKTSTRDLTYAVMSSAYKVGKNIKNFNNRFGIPLSILRFSEDTEVAVLEMGMDGFGQIKTLVGIVSPDIGIITNIGVSHIERLGSREGILRAKMEITSLFNEESILIVNGDCDLLSKERVSGNYRTITIGKGKQNDYVVTDILDYGDKGIEFTISYGNERKKIALPLPGAHNAYNCALAIAAANKIGIDTDTAIKGLSMASLTEKRLEIIDKDGVKIINDTYNASPDSMKSAINTLMNTEGRRKIAVLGDMFELGKDSQTMHYDIGRFAGQRGVDMLLTFGEAAAHIVDGAEDLSYNQKRHYTDKEDLMQDLKNQLTDGDVVLIKASRGMAFEEIVKYIQI